MTEQDQTPDVTDDTEGHRYSRAADGLDDVEGVDSVDDDTEGHIRRAADDIDDDDDDVEGHRRVL
jgi:hypothetical protein